MAETFLGRLARIWLGGGLFVALLLAVVQLETLDPATSRGPYSARIAIACQAGVVISLVIMVSLTVGAVRASLRRARSRRGPALEVASGATSVNTVMEAAATSRFEDPPVVCARCSAPAERMFGFTKIPVCMDCYSKPGVCQSCGRNFGSDAALIVIGAGKNCKECDARLERAVVEGFRSRTVIR